LLRLGVKRQVKQQNHDNDDFSDDPDYHAKSIRACMTINSSHSRHDAQAPILLHPIGLEVTLPPC
jgi:hypothetical protein